MNEACKSLGATYIRFVDDFVVICKTKKDIKYLWKLSNEFLKNKLHITLHLISGVRL